ncbi:NAD(P)H-dependent glycerol-3-phosphate dehydrogenase [gamma proteobacterium HTCC5015]|nr:NAD(P)H-dependent glycerol-3-phosphate dehydrogenase [gamma proteobacterium HTCC5015]
MASVTAANGIRTILWGRNAEQMAAMQQSHRNERYLPNLDLPEGLEFTADLDYALSEANQLEIVTPSGAFRETVRASRDFLQRHPELCWATKGLEYGTNQFLHDVACEETGQTLDMAVISGPSFAGEVVRQLPTAVTVASNNEDYARRVASYLHNHSWFRAYTSDDMTGVQLGGAVKNVLAIAAGIADGLGFGMNTRAGLITRGLNTIVQLGVELGAHTETFMGLAGMGDLILTCSDDQSRNRRFGLALARGEGVEAAQQSIGQAVEGIKSAKAAWELAQAHEVDMPIVEQVYAIIYEDKDPKQAVIDLLKREQKDEVE